MFGVTKIAIEIFFMGINATNPAHWKDNYQNGMKSIEKYMDDSRSIFYGILNDPKEIIRIVDGIRKEDMLFTSITTVDPKYKSIDDLLENGLTREKITTYLNKFRELDQARNTLSSSIIPQSEAIHLDMKVAEYRKFVEVMAEKKVIPSVEGKNDIAFSAICETLIKKISTIQGPTSEEREIMKMAFDKSVETMRVLTNNHWNMESREVNEICDGGNRLFDENVFVAIEGVQSIQDALLVMKEEKSMIMEEYMELENMLELVITIFRNIKNYINGVSYLKHGKTIASCNYLTNAVHSLRDILDRLIYLALGPANVHEFSYIFMV